jgi:hypothetical protein
MKTNYFAIKYAYSVKWDRQAASPLPPELWETHWNDNVPISTDFYAPQRANNELEENLDRFENKARDGSELSAEKDEDADSEEGKSKDELDDEKILKLKKKIKDKKQKKKKVFQPHPFYESAYGYTGFEGAYTSPLEYYSGGISEEPGAITNNPYNNTYQASLASSRAERIKIRAMIFDDVIKSKTPVITSESISKEDMYNFNPISKPLKSLEEAQEIAHKLEREGHEEIVILHGQTKHQWHSPEHPNYKIEIKHWWQVGQL